MSANANQQGACHTAGDGRPHMALAMGSGTGDSGWRTKLGSPRVHPSLRNSPWGGLRDIQDGGHWSGPATKLPSAHLSSN